MNDTTTKVKGTKAQMSHKQFFAICQWFERGHKELLGQPTTYGELAARAKTDLGFPVSEYAVKNALEATGRTMKSKTNNTKAAREATDGITRAVAKHLAALYEKLGEPVPEELAHLL